MTQKKQKLQTFKQSPMGLFQQFRKNEDGSLLYFGLLMFILILWFGGMAVDLMRYETTRAKLQGSLDRATLAAADLDQTLPAADVVRDYMAKDNTLQYLQGDPYVDTGINYRVVSIDATVDMPLFFYDLPRIFVSPFTTGMSALSVSGTSTAEERVTDVEISLVLDVSTSMSNDGRIEALRPAARSFVTTVLENNTNAPEGLITISMVPYSAVVNPGTNISAYLDANDNVNRTHDYSTCLKFDDDEFLTTELDLDVSYDHISHFDPYWYYASPNYQPIEYSWCYTGDKNAIVPATSEEDRLHTAIDALEPYGNTAIDMGVKWGVALLDPSTEDLITSLASVDDSGVADLAVGRPEAYVQEEQVLKIMVLMTDGTNTSQYDLYDRFKYNLSFVWFELDDPTEAIQDVGDQGWAVQYSGQRTPTDYSDDLFYWNGETSSGGGRRGRGDDDDEASLKDYPRGFESQSDYIDAMEDGDGTALGYRGVIYPNNALQASWQELFATHVYSEVNDEYLEDAEDDDALDKTAGLAWTSGHTGSSYQIYLPDYSDTDSAIDYSVVNSSEADDRLSDLCEAARLQGIIIYTIAFEAPSGGQAALSDCASSTSHYFNVEDTDDISDTFSAIASDIRALKLTQ